MRMHIVAGMATSSPPPDYAPDCPPAAHPGPPVLARAAMPASRPQGASPANRPLAASPPIPQQWNARTWAVLLVLCGALFLDALDVSMIGVALPVIRTDLHLSTSSLQWIVSAYVLGYGGLLLLGGRAADLFGRRRTFLVGVVVLNQRS